MRARVIHEKGSCGDQEYVAIEVYGKEVGDTEGYPYSIILRTPAVVYGKAYSIEDILDEIARRINENDVPL